MEIKIPNEALLPFKEQLTRMRQIKDLLSTKKLEKKKVEELESEYHCLAREISEVILKAFIKIEIQDQQ